jgi:hypothetical protein
MKTQSIIRQTVIVLFSLCVALSLRAQDFFQATLEIPLAGGGGGLILGNFWCQVVGNELDFMATVAPSTFSSSLNPILFVPGSSIEFSLGEAQSGYTGSLSDPFRNPFLPPLPLVPSGYDEDGNPYYLTTGPIFSFDNFYSGHIDLPPGVADELLAGQGTVQINPSIGGNIFVSPTPEPSTLALAATAGCGWLLAMRRRGSRERKEPWDHATLHGSRTVARLSTLGGKISPSA